MPTLLHQIPSKKTISVKIRIKPSQSTDTVPYTPTHITVNNRTYNFQHIFPPTASQSQLFEHIVPLLDSFIEGFNTTVVVYGQTGSGKTYTMGTTPEQMVYNYEGDSLPCIGDNTPLINNSYDNPPLINCTNYSTPLINCTNNNTPLINCTNDNTPLINSTNNNTLGILPRSVIYLFNKITVPITLSFIEIYNEEVYDLLSDNKVPLNIRENNGIPILTGVSKHVLYSIKCAFNKLNKGLLERKTKSTKMNLNSSRSHAIITLQVKEKLLTFVDLAGSERMERSGVKGEKVKECISINSGLLSLSNVINSLYKKSQHIPFRDSKLTRLLQPSFIGECYTLVVGCISLEGVDLGEGVNTLVYCYRICCIEGGLIRRKVVSVDYKEEVLKVRKENENLVGEIRRLEGVIDGLKRENEKLYKEIERVGSKLEGVSDKDRLGGVNNGTSSISGVNKSNIDSGLKGVSNKDLVNNNAFTPSKIIKGLNIRDNINNSKKDYLNDNNLKGVNRSVLCTRLTGTNRSTIDSRLKGVNRSTIDSRLKGGNRSTIGNELKGVNRSTIGNELKGVNRSTIGNELKGVNRSTIGNEIKGVNRSTIGNELKGVNNQTKVSSRSKGVNKDGEIHGNSNINPPAVTRGIFNTSSKPNYQRLLKDGLVNNNSPLSQDNNSTVINTPLSRGLENTNNTDLLQINNPPLNNSTIHTPLTLKRKDLNQSDNKKIKGDKRRVTFKINTTLTPVKYKKGFKVINTLLFNKGPVTGIGAYNGVIYTCSLNNTIIAYSINKGGVINSYEDKEGLSNLSVINGCYLSDSTTSYNNTPLFTNPIHFNNTPTSLYTNTPLSNSTLPFTDNMTVTDSNVLYYSNNNFKVIDMKYNKEVLKIKTSSTITCMKTKGCYIIGGHENGNISIFDTRMYDKPLYYKNIHKSTIFSIDLHNSSVYSGSRDHTIGVFDFNLNNTLLLSPPHYDSVTCVLIYKDSLISGSRDCSLKRWSIEGKSVIKTYPYAHESWVKSLCLSEGCFVSGGKDCKIKGWGFNDKSLVSLGGCSVKGGVNCIVEDDGVLFIGSQDRNVYVVSG